MTSELTKIGQKYGTDKAHKYTELYSKYFEEYKDEPINLLEIGVYKGASHMMWKEYFSKASIYGIDNSPACKNYQDERITMFTGDQSNEDFVIDCLTKMKTLDIIIDDGGHTMNQQKTSFELLFLNLKDDGIYIIEDLQTSYNRNFGDSPMSMITYIKNLIDYVNYVGSRMHQGNPFQVDHIPHLPDEFEDYLVRNIYSIHLYNTICFIFKKDLTNPNNNPYI